MKIDSIRIVENLQMFTYKGIKYTPVELTLKTWYGKKTNIIAYPTNQGPTFGNVDILWITYVNAKGKEIDNIYCEQFSKQICNYLTVQTLNKNI